MRIRTVDALITQPDLHQYLTAELELPSFVRILSVTATDGALSVRASASILFASYEVDLVLRVATVEPTRLRLQVEASAGLSIVGKILDPIIRNLAGGGVSFDGSHLTVAVPELAAKLGTEFRLRQVSFTARGIEVGLDDVVVHRQSK